MVPPHDEHATLERLRARSRELDLDVDPAAAAALLIEAPAPRDIDAAIVVAGCLAGEARAQAVFQERYFRRVRPALKGMGLPDAVIDDIKQRVWVKLFVAQPGDEPAIVEYLGKGDLEAFVKVVATRFALSDHRRRKPQVGDEVLVDVAHQGASPQLAYAHAANGEVFREAVEEAAAMLEPEDRLVLRLCHIDGLTVDEIGSAFGVHRATAARRVARARERLVDTVRALLKQRLALDSAELDSVMRDVQSQLHVSISRILAP